jgi:hypothetical protein
MDEKSLLAAARAKQTIEEEKPVEKPATKPSQIPVTFTYYTESGEEKTCTLPIRVLNFDERNYARILAATLANGKFNILPDEHAAFLTALATIFTLWPNELPKELQALLHEDEALAINVYNLIEGHRIARFRGDGAESARRPATVRLADSP